MEVKRQVEKLITVGRQKQDKKIVPQQMPRRKNGFVVVVLARQQQQFLKDFMVSSNLNCCILCS